MKDNIRFNWSHIYYKGQKYESLGEKVFKYSFVELEDSPIEPGSKTAVKLLDITFGSKSSNSIGYQETYMADYLNKVMRQKMLVRETHIPYLFGKTILKRYEDANDGDNYHNLKGYYENRTVTPYSQYTLDRKADFRFINVPLYSADAVGFIATASQYSHLGELVGIWTFYPYGSPNNKQGLLWSARYNEGNLITPLFVQPIINY